MGAAWDGNVLGLAAENPAPKAPEKGFFQPFDMYVELINLLRDFVRPPFDLNTPIRQDTSTAVHYVHVN